MANPEHLEILERGVEEWNKWREKNPFVKINLYRANLKGADLRGVNFRSADLTGACLDDADLSGANLKYANLTCVRPNLCTLYEGIVCANLNGTNLSRANLEKANLTSASLIYANLQKANLCETNFYLANLLNANLEGTDLIMTNLECAKLSLANLCNASLGGVNLSSARLARANLEHVKICMSNLTNANLEDAKLNGADLSHSILNCVNLSRAALSNTDLFNASLDGARIHGASFNNCKISEISVRGDIKGEPKEQKDFIIPVTEYLAGETEVSIDNIMIAQLFFSLFNNAEMNNPINTNTPKVALIIGGFRGEGRTVLNSLKDLLRGKGYVTIFFDFDKKTDEPFTKTIQTLASLSKFVIADITDAKSIPQELSHIVPNYPSIPVKPIILASQREYGMFEHWRKYPWVLEAYEYPSLAVLEENLDIEVVGKAEEKLRELNIKR